MASAAEEAAVSLKRRLAELRRAVGSPSFKALEERYAPAAGVGLPHSTAQNALDLRKPPPKDSTVRAFVAACKQSLVLTPQSRRPGVDPGLFDLDQYQDLVQRAHGKVVGTLDRRPAPGLERVVVGELPVAPPGLQDRDELDQLAGLVAAGQGGQRGVCGRLAGGWQNPVGRRPGPPRHQRLGLAAGGVGLRR